MVRITRWETEFIWNWVHLLSIRLVRRKRTELDNRTDSIELDELDENNNNIVCDDVYNQYKKHIEKVTLFAWW